MNQQSKMYLFPNGLHIELDSTHELRVPAYDPFHGDRGFTPLDGPLNPEWEWWMHLAMCQTVSCRG